MKFHLATSTTLILMLPSLLANADAALRGGANETKAAKWGKPGHFIKASSRTNETSVETSKMINGPDGDEKSAPSPRSWGMPPHLGGDHLASEEDDQNGDKNRLLFPFDGEKPCLWYANPDPNTWDVLWPGACRLHDTHRGHEGYDYKKYYLDWHRCRWECAQNPDCLAVEWSVGNRCEHWRSPPDSYEQKCDFHCLVKNHP